MARITQEFCHLPIIKFLHIGGAMYIYFEDERFWHVLISIVLDNWNCSMDKGGDNK